MAKSTSLSHSHANQGAAGLVKEKMSRAETHPLAIIFFFNETAPPEIYTLSLHDALPIWHYLRRRFPAFLHQQVAGRDPLDRGFQILGRRHRGVRRIRGERLAAVGVILAGGLDGSASQDATDRSEEPQSEPQ